MFKFYIKNSIVKKEDGFTLIEVLVSLSIFIMVIVMAVSVMLTMVDANTKARNIQSAMTNLSFALDSMTREIRTGSNYYCESGYYADLSDVSNSLPTDASARDTRDCTEGNSYRYAFAFREGGNSLTSSCSGKWVGYRFNPYDNTIERRLCNGSWQSIISDDVMIEKLSFTVSGSDPSDDLTPIVTIYIAGRVMGTEKTQTAFGMQTTVSQHLLDL